MSPCRAEASGLADTRICSCPLPWPEDGATPVIHAVSDEADHAHSGCVVTSTVVVAPLELTGEAGGARVTAHLVGDGPVDVATVEPHPAAAQAISHAATYVSGLREVHPCPSAVPEPASKILGRVVLRRQMNAGEKNETSPRTSNRRASQNFSKRTGILGDRVLER